MVASDEDRATGATRRGDRASTSGNIRIHDIATKAHGTNLVLPLDVATAAHL